MKCTNRKLLAVLLTFSIITGCCGCGSDLVKDSYKLYDSSYHFNLLNSGYTSNVKNGFFAEELCVAGAENIGVSAVDSEYIGAGGCFNMSTHETTYAQNVHSQMYPASTTKILTMLVAIENGDLNDYVHVSAEACKQAADSSVIHLHEGDVISVEELLYGIELRSGNDAAMAIAEGVGGSVEAFVDMMNKKCQEIGATNTHFVNPNGLHDDNHYTTVYDMYLILDAALRNQTFYSIFTAKKHSAAWTRADGSEVKEDWESTNQYFTGKASAPANITVLGGKTGTTGAAGYCLVLYSTNSVGEPVISIVFNADGRSNLYYVMNEILSVFGG